MHDIEQLKAENAELKRQLKERRFDTFVNCLQLVNVLVITTQKWDTWLFYLFAAELLGLFAWIILVTFCDSKKS